MENRFFHRSRLPFAALIIPLIAAAGLAGWSTLPPRLTPEELSCLESPLASALSICIAPFLQQNAGRPGPYLEALQALVNEGTIADCHELAHELGHISYAFFDDLESALAAGNHLCLDGYTHGVAMAAAHAEGSGEQMQICKTLADPERLPCVHGLGHGLLHEGNDDFRVALKRCRTLNDPGEVGACEGGTAMENSMRFMDLSAPAFSREIRSACMQSPKRYLQLCYSQIGEIAAFYYLRDSSAVYDICDDLALAHGRRWCREGADAELAHRQ